jgi:uncharacterized protein YndB with AHSA1/START domain
MNRYTILVITVFIIAVLLTCTPGFAREKDNITVSENQFNNNNYLLTLKYKKMNTDTINMVTTRIFDASPEQVWKAWSKEEMVKQWWGPRGFTCPVAKIVFREGGTSLVCMRAPKEYGGKDIYNTWSYQKIVTMERIEYVLNFTDKDGNKFDPSAMGMPAGIPKEVPHIITFRDLGNNKTEVTVTEYGYTSAEVVALSKAGMNECLDKMAEALARQ